MIKGDEVGVTIATIHSEKLAPHTHLFRDEFTKHHYSFRMLDFDSKHVDIIVKIKLYIIQHPYNIISYYIHDIISHYVKIYCGIIMSY